MKLLVLIFVYSFFFVNSFAQVSFGVKAGYNVNFYVINIDFVNKNSQNISSSGGGFFVGAFLKLPVSTKLSISPELQYSRRGGEYFSDNYIELPILLTLSPIRGLDFDLGVNTGLFLSSNIDKSNSRFDFGLVSGFKINLSERVSLVSRYYLGLIPARSITDFNLTFNGVTLDPTAKSWDEYNRTIQFGMGYKIK